jgi:hypothetical protein
VCGSGKKFFTEDGGDEGVLHGTTNSSAAAAAEASNWGDVDSEGASHGRAGE